MAWYKNIETPYAIPKIPNSNAADISA